MIETYLLEALVAFKDCQTLSAASEKLHISQPALSRSMQKLEDILGVSLFERTKNKITLNSTGELAASFARNILQSEEEMITLVRNYDSSLHTISVGACAPGPLMELATILPNLFPDATFSSTTKKEEALINDLLVKKYNLCITTNNINNEHIFSVPYGNEHLYIGVIAAHPLSHYKDTGICFSDVDGESFLVFSDVGIWKQVIEHMLPNSRFITQSDMDTLSTLINSSSLLSFATDITIRMIRNRDNPDRVFIPINDPEATITFYCNYLISDSNRLEPLLNYLK